MVSSLKAVQQSNLQVRHRKHRLLDIVQRVKNVQFHQQTKMRDLESIDQDSLTPDASIRDFQKPSEPSTPIDKGIQSDLRGIAELEQASSTSPTLTTMVPKQPVLPEYPGTKFSSESFTRRFQPDWYKKYPWLSYDVEKDVCVCFACIEFGKDASFVFKN